MSLSFHWPTLTTPPKIAEGHIHVYAWQLDFVGLEQNRIALLDANELQRYHRYHFERDRARFAISHSNLREILGACLDRNPSEIAFQTTSYGKPEIVADAQTPHVYFNLSHSRNTALLAISRDTEVGVDVEDVKPIEPEVAEKYFSSRELAALALLEGDAWLQGFYRCWTRKEAILKAEGVGLNLPLSCFDVSLLPGVPAQLLAVRPPAVFRHPWTLHELTTPPTTVAALATGSPHAEVSCFFFA